MSDWTEKIAQVWDGSTWLDLPVIDITASEDVDRESYTAARLTLDWHIGAPEWDALEPRNQNVRGVAPVRWRIAHWAHVNDVPTLLGYLPGIGSSAPDKARYARMWVRTVRRDTRTRTIEVECAGGESMLADKKRVSGSTLNTAATTVQALVLYSLYDVFGSATLASDAVVVSTAIPAGDRRLMLPGESHIDLVKPELDAINCRLYDVYGLQWNARDRDLVGAAVSLGTYEGADGGGALPIVLDATETVTRDGNWADGVLIKYDPPGGTVSYHVSGGGVNTRAITITRDRAAPSGNAANDLAARTIQRGRTTDATCMFRTDIRAATAMELHTSGPVWEGIIRAVEWDTATMTMAIRAQTGELYE